MKIISLLGRKADGFSEFAYYPFRSENEAGTKPTFAEWLNGRYPGRFEVTEIPTVDAQGVPFDVLAKAIHRILELLAHDVTVVVMDSAGAERTARVCEAAGFVLTP